MAGTADRTVIAEFTGGPLDGGTRVVPPHVHTAVTMPRDGAASYYARDDDTGTFVFTGQSTQGAVMAGIIRRFTEAARREREAVSEALQPRGCPACGLVFGSHAAYTVAHDPHWPGGCLPPGAAGQLEQHDGVWVIPGSDAARRLRISDALSVKKVIAQA